MSESFVQLPAILISAIKPKLLWLKLSETNFNYDVSELAMGENNDTRVVMDGKCDGTIKVNMIIFYLSSFPP